MRNAHVMKNDKLIDTRKQTLIITLVGREDKELRNECSHEIQLQIQDTVNANL